jgi:hypothetical protein
MRITPDQKGGRMCSEHLANQGLDLLLEYGHSAFDMMN